MLSFFVHQVLPLLGTLALGAIGWWVTHWVANPIIEFHNLRRSIREELFFTEKVGDISEIDELRETQAVLRRLAARMDAATVAISGPFRRYLKLRKFDLENAKEGLTGLSNTLRDQTGSKALFRHKVETALRLPTAMTDDQAKAVALQLGISPQAGQGT